MKWEDRKRVRNCSERVDVDCPRCGLGVCCVHEDVGEDDCSEDNCPLWNGKRWKVAKLRGK